jgi:hypothetical protein
VNQDPRNFEFFARVKGKGPLKKSFEGSTGARELIQLPNSNDPKIKRSRRPQGVVGVCIKWYQSVRFVCRQQEKEIGLSGIIKWYKEKGIESLCERKLGTMPSRRRRDRPVANPTMEEEMR